MEGETGDAVAPDGQDAEAGEEGVDGGSEKEPCITV